MYKLDHRLNLPIKKMKLIAKHVCVFGKYILTRMFEMNAKGFQLFLYGMSLKTFFAFTSQYIKDIYMYRNTVNLIYFMEHYIFMDLIARSNHQYKCN